jgi:hypothetical protein
MAEILGSLARRTLRYSRLGLATPARRKESARNWLTTLDVAADAAEKLIEDSCREAVRQLEARESSTSPRARSA